MVMVMAEGYIYMYISAYLDGREKPPDEELSQGGSSLQKKYRGA